MYLASWIIKIARISIKREWVRLIIKQPIKGWLFYAFSQSPTIPPTEDRGLWLRDWARIEPTISRGGGYTDKNATDLVQLVNFIKLQQVCSDQAYRNLSFADLLQLVETSCKKPVKLINLQQVCWPLATYLLSKAVASHANASWYRLVVTSCYKMLTDLLQLGRFWLRSRFITFQII